MPQPSAAETSAGPLGLIIIAVSVGAMLFVFFRSARARRTALRVQHGPLAAPAAAPLPAGSAAAMTDAGQVPARLLLTALAVEGSTAVIDSEDEGIGAMLGLQYHRFHHRDQLWDPPVYEGTRNGHQVFIRLGRNASVRGPGVNARRLRAVAVVRASAPPFELATAGGALIAHTPVPPPVAAVLAAMRPSPDVWHDLRVVCGPEGLAANRGLGGDWLGGWIYDLWLLERLAACLRSAPLPPVPLERDWTPPYELGEWAPSVL
jgi:hypothetical protein